MFREYFEYRKNRKAAKREMAKTMATALPVVNGLVEESTIIGELFKKLVVASKNVKTEELYPLIISELANAFKTNESRLIETLTYMATLSPEDMQKILVHSVVESNDEISHVE